MQTVLIQISSITGTTIFEYKCKDNNIRKTLEEAIRKNANLRNANLEDANLENATIHGIKIKKAIIFTALYKYIVMAIIALNNEEYIKMGCHCRTVEEWENDFWNNNDEFPNDNSLKSNSRIFGFETGKKWIAINRENL